jgi:hydrogenase maturation protease
MERMVSYRCVIVVDAVVTGAVPPGTVSRMTLEDVRRLRAGTATRHSCSPHDADLVTALDLGRSAGMELPVDIVIVAVEAENVLDFGGEPTPAVAAAIPSAADVVIDQLKRWGVAVATEPASDRPSGGSRTLRSQGG